MYNTIKIPSYTIFELQGKITLGSATNLLNANEPEPVVLRWFIVNEHAAYQSGGTFNGGSNDTQIEIIGGIYDQINNPANVYGFCFRKVTNSSITGVTIKNTGETAIALENECAEVTVHHNWIFNPGYDGIGTGGFNSINHDIWFTDNVIRGPVPHNGIVVEQHCYAVHIESNSVSGATGAGIAIEGASYNFVVDNSVSDSGSNGIFIYDVNNIAASGNLVMGNKASYNDQAGIAVYSTLQDCVRNRITDNIVYGNSQEAGAFSGIYIHGSENIITGNICYGQEWGITETGVAAVNNIIALNNCNGNSVGGIFSDGTGTYVNLCFNGTAGYIA
jgi:parallel beta-helix repeat protein